MGSEPSLFNATMVDVQAMPPMWPETSQAYKVDRRGRHVTDLQGTGIMEGQLFSKEKTFVDSRHFMELLDSSGSGDSQQASLLRLYEDRQNNALNLLKQQLEALNTARLEAERRQIQIMEESMYEPMYNAAEGSAMSEESPRYENFLGEDGPGSWSSVHGSDTGSVEMEGDSFGLADYWRDRSRSYAKLLTDSIRREELLIQKLNEYALLPFTTAQPLEELRQQLHRFDNFLRFSLRKAPVVIGHQDSDLRYRFVYNAYPTLTEEEVIGKTDIEIYKGTGVSELMDFKREVMRKGYPEKREITFNTDMFGEKTFLIAVEPVMSRGGEAMGLNYIAMDVSEQVDKRERIARLREQVAVQKAMEAELHKTIHITEETMRAKQMLATMSHEIRSPLSGVVSVAEVLATTELDAEQRQLVDVMVSSGDLVLQLINDILDLSKVESGAMKFEAKKFRPREVVKHVLQMALASKQEKNLVLEGRIYDDVPLEECNQVHSCGVCHNKHSCGPAPSPAIQRVAKNVFQAATGYFETAPAHPVSFSGTQHGAPRNSCSSEGISRYVSQQCAPAEARGDLDLDEGIEDIIWLHCEVSDTGIGIPESALPTLFEKYTQVSTTHARKYGGTGLGLAICKNLVEMMGGSLTVVSKENQGSTFSFTLPLRVAPGRSSSGGQLSDEVYDMMTNEAKRDGVIDKLAATKQIGYYHFTSKVASRSSRKLSISPRTRSSSSTIMSDALAKSSFEQQKSKALPIRRERSLNRRKPTTLGFFQNSPAEFMDVDSTAPDQMQYIPGLSMPQCQSLGPVLQKSILDVSSSYLPSKPRSSRGSAGQSTKARKAQERSPLAHSTFDLLHQRTSRILLAEDNKVNVMVAQSMMKRLGHTLEVVSNGAEAIEAVQQNSYDVILMDVCMPVMDGLEATRRIRCYEETGSWDDSKEGETKRIVNATSWGLSPSMGPGPTPSLTTMCQRTPIIAMTANALADNVRECYTHGMDSFIAKPVTFTKLEQVLKQFIPCLDRSQNLSVDPASESPPDL